MAAQKEKLRAALKTRGQIVNLLVRPLGGDQFEVVNGNHRLEIFQEEGVEKAFAFDLGEIPDDEAMLIATETNELEVEADPLKLGAMIAKIHANGRTLEQIAETLPYSPEELRGLIEQTNFSWDRFEPTAPAAGDGETEEDEPESSRKLLAIELPKDLRDAFKGQLSRWDENAEPIRMCVEYLKTLTP